MPSSSEATFSNAENQPSAMGQYMDWSLSRFYGLANSSWLTTHDKLESPKPLTLLQRRFMIAHLNAYGFGLMVGNVTDLDGNQALGDLDEVYQPSNRVFPEKKHVPLVLQNLRLTNGYTLTGVYSPETHSGERGLLTRFEKKTRQGGKEKFFDYQAEPFVEKTFKATYMLQEHLNRKKSNASILNISVNDGDEIPSAWLSIQLKDTENNDVLFDYDQHGILNEVRILLKSEYGYLSSFTQTAIESINKNVYRRGPKRYDYATLRREEFPGNIHNVSELFDLVHYGYVRESEEDRDITIDISATIKLMVAAASEDSFKQAYECLVFSE